MNQYLLSTVLFLLGAMLLIKPSPAELAPGDSPLVGVHTIRADDDLLQRAVGSGFTWLVQLLEWREVEPVPGEHFWEYADWLVRATEYYGLDLVLRLDHPPEWVVSPNGAVPVDVAEYAAFVGRVAARYRGRVRAYVIWNEPNLAAEWGEQSPNPAGYVDLLCAAHAAVRASDPEALVVSAGLAPTNHANESALDDRRYLQAMYAAGAASCFDVLGVHPYGFAYPPDDPYEAHDGLNYARLADVRAVMVEAEDGEKPVWATELGWTTGSAGPDRQWLEVSEQEQARYLMGAFEKASQEWPWLEGIAVWNMSAGLAAEDEKRGYSLLADDRTPKPAYVALAAMAREQDDSASAIAPVGDAHGGQAETAEIEILAPDVVVRLSDVDTFYPHWARPHCGTVPCRHWSSQFYLRDPGAGIWQLRMEIMQVEEPGNLVWINDQPLDPPAIPLRYRPDFASVWTAAEMPVLPDVLRPGVNTIEIRSSPRPPLAQDTHAHFESLQFRRLRLVTDS